MAIRALDRKLLRDLWRLRGHLLAIALVAMCGTASLVTMRGAYDAIVAARDAFYLDYRFADVFAVAKRVPRTLLPALREIDGVAVVHERLSFLASVDVPALDDPAFARLMSIPERGAAPLNAVHLKRGRLPDPNRPDEMLVSEAFADAHGYRPGDRLALVINGRRQRMTLAGIAISPEFVNEAFEGSIVPDPKRFAVFWLPRPALEAALDMRGAFNNLAVTLAPGAEAGHVIAELDRLLAPYGGRGAHGRPEQFSHAMLEDELRQTRVTGAIVPAVFLAVTAFLIHNVLLRLLALQRAQIGVLKAFGYSSERIALHFVQLAGIAVGAGTIAGIALGAWLGSGLTALYRDFYHFPSFGFTLTGEVLATVAATALVTVAGGALPALRRVMRLPPAEAMRPESPARFTATFAERLGLARWMPMMLRMTVRNIERRPLRSALAVLAVAMAASLLILGRFAFDSIDEIVRVQFRLGMREDVGLYFLEPRRIQALYDVRAQPEVTHAEPFRFIGVRIRSGHRVKRASIHAHLPDATLRRVLDRSERLVPLPPDGIVMASALAELLEVRVGDRVTVEVLEGAQRVREVAVAAIVDEYIGLTCYMDLTAAARLLGEDVTIGGVYATIDASRSAALFSRLKGMPVIGTIGRREAIIRSFQDTIARNLGYMTLALAGFGCAIAGGMVYNGARISLSEHAIELASLRILGFTRAEVAALVIGEQTLITLAAIPLGLAIGYGAAAVLAQAASGEMFRLPLALGAGTFLFATGVVVVSAVVSALVVLARLRRFDLVEALKTRE